MRRATVFSLAVLVVATLAVVPNAVAVSDRGHREVVVTKKKKPKKAKVAKALFFQTGSGTATTGTFKVPSDWDLKWSYDCTAFFGGQGNFIVSIYDYYGEKSQLDFDNQGINQLGPKGEGVDHYHSGGNKKFFKVISECSWALAVQRGKSG